MNKVFQDIVMILKNSSTHTYENYEKSDVRIFVLNSILMYL